VTVDGLLYPTADLVHSVGAEFDHVKAIEDRDGVLELVLLDQQAPHGAPGEGRNSWRRVGDAGVRQ
jgi:hypothetical protein